MLLGAGATGVDGVVGFNIPPTSPPVPSKPLSVVVEVVDELSFGVGGTVGWTSVCGGGPVDAPSSYVDEPLEVVVPL